MSRESELVVGISGASGTALAVRFLELASRASEISRIHLVVSPHAVRVATHELGEKLGTAEDLARRGEIDQAKIEHHHEGDIGASIASGSYRVRGMIVIPCSAGTLASIASGVSRGLIQRAADLNLKERRPVILALRETPLSAIHAENILSVTRAGAIVMPPVPSFYSGQDWDSFIDHFCMRALDLFGVETDLDGLRWNGMERSR